MTQTYFYKFQRESGRVTEKGPTKMDNAKKVFEKMTLDGNLKKDSEQAAKTKAD